jgi:hypothetical protein
LRKTIKTIGYFVLTQDLNCKSVAHIKDSIQSPVFWLPEKLGRAETKLTISKIGGEFYKEQREV